MNNERFNELMARELYGTASPEELAELDALAASPRLKEARTRYRQTSAILEQYLDAGHLQSRPKNKSWPALQALAAIVAIAFAGFLIWQKTKPGFALNVPPACGAETSGETVILKNHCRIEQATPAGSFVLENSGEIAITRSSADFFLDLRRGSLRIRETGKPPIAAAVYAGALRISPVGTDYTVLRKDSEVMIEVISGSVNVDQSAAFLDPLLARDLEISGDLGDLRRKKLLTNEKTTETMTPELIATMSAAVARIKNEPHNAKKILETLPTMPSIVSPPLVRPAGLVLIRLRDGRTLQAKILKQGPTFDLQINGSVITVPAEEIEKVESLPDGQ